MIDYHILNLLIILVAIWAGLLVIGGTYFVIRGERRHRSYIRYREETLRQREEEFQQEKVRKAHDEWKARTADRRNDGQFLDPMRANWGHDEPRREVWDREEARRSAEMAGESWAHSLADKRAGQFNPALQEQRDAWKARRAVRDDVEFFETITEYHNALV